jgi:WD40 repeat protein
LDFGDDSIVSAGSDYSLNVWQLGEMKERKTTNVKLHQGKITSLSFLKGNDILTTSLDGSIKLFCLRD